MVLWSAGVAVLFATTCNLASPVITGQLFEMLAGRQSVSRYPKLLAIFAAMYISEPLVSRVYIRMTCTVAEKVRFPPTSCTPPYCGTPFFFLS